MRTYALIDTLYVLIVGASYILPQSILKLR